MKNLNVKVFINIVFLLLYSYATALANCPYGCQCDDNTLIVQCGEGQLDVLPIALNPSIQRLVIRNNKIKTIDSSIQFYAELTFLDLSSNHLVNIPPRTFIYQRKLQEVHLQNNKIGQISNKTFIGLSSLAVLNLRGNLISELHQGTFAPLAKIEELNLGENRVGFIDPKAFDGLSQLRILYLDDNALTSVPDPVHFQTMANLGELYLGLNSLLSINLGAFQDLTGLTTLNLRGSGLRNLSHDSFVGLEDLRTLDLSDNRFTHIPTISLSRLQRLEVLYLGQNDFESILEGAFTGLKQLKYLDITGSTRLKRIANGAFARNMNLVSLNLSSNKVLAEIQEGAFSNLPHLKEVYLKANALTSLAEGLFHWNDLNVLDVSENLMACDCRIMWLRNLLISKNITGDPVNDVLCEFPERLRGQKLRDLNPTLIGCAHSDSRKQALIGALLVGTAATVTAVALILYRCRYKIRQYMKGDLWDNSALGRKDREYQKTFCDEDYMARHHPLHPSGSGLHATFSNTYTPHHPGHRPMYAINGAMNINGMNDVQKDFQQLQVSSIAMTNADDKNLLKPNMGLSYSGSFTIHMKNSTNQKQTQKLNHYTEPQFLHHSAAVGDSCYSYADLPIIHNSIGNMEAIQQQQQNINYEHTQALVYSSITQSDNYANKDKIIVNAGQQADANYIYNSAHYSLPLEHNCSEDSNSAERKKLTSTPSPIPPALPVRNPPHAINAIGRRSLNQSNERCSKQLKMCNEEAQHNNDTYKKNRPCEQQQEQ